MSGNSLNLRWVSPGPVASRFMASRAPVQIINGPIGSGKTTTALMKAIRLAQSQKVSTRETTVTENSQEAGVRKFKICAVRDTYRQLWKSTIPSWWERVPREVGVFTGGDNAPASHRVGFSLKDGTVVDFTMEFVAIGDNNVEDVMRGYQVTAFYLNEADRLAREVLDFAMGRAGRFPPMEEGGPSWHGIIMDCNAPEFGSWLYDDIFTKSATELRAQGIELFRQPSALGPNAENISNLVPGYYENQRHGRPEWYVARMLENKPGYNRDGKPVYPEFNDGLHVPDADMEAAEGLPLTIGLDAGGSPGAAFGQRMPDGQWRILDEIVGEPGTGARRFGQMLAQRLRERFPAVRRVSGWADPSAAYGADKAAGESSWIEIVSATAEIRVDAAPTNKPIPRWEAVRLPLTRLIDGKPGLLLNPRCKTLRAGFNAGYHFRKVQGTNRFGEEAEKNEYSHVHDALQYLLSGGGEDRAIRDRGRDHREARAKAASDHEHDWNPLGLA